MVIYLYRWKLKPGHESDFITAWTIVTAELKSKCGSLGSRLHSSSDGLYYGYAQWPNKETRDNARLSSTQVDDARKRMRDAMEESLPEIILDPLSDYLEFRNPGAAPIIATSRLIMRAHSKEDFADCSAMWSNPDVTRNIGGNPSSPQQTWARILNYIGHWNAMGYGYWAVEEKSSGKFIGELGFADFKRDLDASVAGLPELGWAFAPEFHGKGFASEAVRAVVVWGDKCFGSTKTMCIINPENVRSIKIAEKNGYKLLMQTTYSGQPTLVFARELGDNC